MIEPVRASSGIYYEKTALLQKLNEEGIGPGKAKCLVTGKAFAEADRDVTVNLEMANHIQTWIHEHR
jgi:hypothetical protein